MLLKKFKLSSLIRSSVLVFILLLVIFRAAHADDISDLQAQINQRNANIAQLEKEIAQYQALADKTTAQAKSLQKAILSLQATQKKLDASIKITQTKIDVANLDIQKLNIQIGDKTKNIHTGQGALAEAMRKIQQTDSESIVTSILSRKNLGDIWNDVQNIITFQSSVRERVLGLKTLKAGLEKDQASTTVEKNNLQIYQKQLSDQEKVVLYNQQQQRQLLTETKNQEKIYQQTISDKQAKKAAFEKELYDYESQLKFKLDPSTLPKAGSGVLSWPLDKVRVTQLFGVTNASARLYVSGSHNGVDFGVSIGTPVKAVADGAVEGATDTDLVCPGASFGRYVFIRHYNGLATTYGHLSVISVREGQQVHRGDIIGYSGSTGYATGPHLHLSVYASAGVQMKDLPSKVCGNRIYRLPIAAVNGYLDPLLYLPGYSGPTQ